MKNNKEKGEKTLKKCLIKIKEFDDKLENRKHTYQKADCLKKFTGKLLGNLILKREKAQKWVYACIQIEELTAGT